jgi:hypothetical protein
MKVLSNDPNDRFGVPEQLIIDAMKAHDGLIRDGCYVPTRSEVATLKLFPLTWILLGWWWESPSELIPSDEQVAAVIEILRSRPDANNPIIMDLIARRVAMPSLSRRRTRDHGD